MRHLSVSKMGRAEGITIIKCHITQLKDAIVSLSAKKGTIAKSAIVETCSELIEHPSDLPELVPTDNQQFPKLVLTYKKNFLGDVICV